MQRLQSENAGAAMTVYINAEFEVGKCATAVVASIQCRVCCRRECCNLQWTPICPCLASSRVFWSGPTSLWKLCNARLRPQEIILTDPYSLTCAKKLLCEKMR